MNPDFGSVDKSLPFTIYMMDTGTMFQVTKAKSNASKLTEVTFAFDFGGRYCVTVYTRQPFFEVKRILNKRNKSVTLLKKLEPVTGDGGATGHRETYCPFFGVFSGMPK